MASSANLRKALEKIGLPELIKNFSAERVDDNVFNSLSDTDLTRLGLQTIGDRVRMREEMKNLGSSGFIQERTSLFRPGAANQIRPKPKKPRTWTTTFICLADRNTSQVPSASQKAVLQNAGLGSKRISFPVHGDETCVKENIHSNFVKLKDAGGFELLKVMNNCRTLEFVNSKWDVDSLKSIFGGQCKVYIRPIQENLPIDSINASSATSSVKEQCKHCNKDIAIAQLREHVKWCSITEVTVSEDEAEVKVSETSEEVLPDIVSPDIEIMNTDDHEAPDTDMNIQNSVEVDDSEVDTATIINTCITDRIDDPVEILRIMQSKIVIGRKLELEDEANDIGEGKTNFILVDRSQLLETGFEEISALDNLRYTLEVQFYGEAAVDNGGPRKEFFRLILIDIKESYLDPLRENTEKEKFEIIGKIFALSLLQNGTLPRILDPDLLKEVFEGVDPRPNLLALRKGLDSLGIVQIAKALPLLVHLFTPVASKRLNIKMMSHLLQPNFSEKGSNQQILESRMYRKFVKYMKEVAAGRRDNVTLGKILRFTTSAEEEPVLGFKLQPRIYFVNSESPLPTANTCICRLNLPRSSDLPEDMLFGMFDLAFCNAYFGLQ